MKLVTVFYKDSPFKQKFSKPGMLRNIEQDNEPEAELLKSELRGMAYEEIPAEDEITAIQYHYLQKDPNLINVLRRPKNFRKPPGTKALAQAVMLPLSNRIKQAKAFLANVKDYEGNYANYINTGQLERERINKERAIRNKAFYDYMNRHLDEIEREQALPGNQPIYSSDIRYAYSNRENIPDAIKKAPKAPKKDRYGAIKYARVPEGL